MIIKVKIPGSKSHTDKTCTADYQKYFAKPRAVNDVASFPSSDLESTTFLDETEDDRLVSMYIFIH